MLVFNIEPRPEMMNRKRHRKASSHTSSAKRKATDKESSKAAKQKAVVIVDSPESYVTHRGGKMIGWCFFSVFTTRGSIHFLNTICDALLEKMSKFLVHPKISPEVYTGVWRGRGGGGFGC